MVAICPDPCADVALVPFLEELVVSVGPLACKSRVPPAVEYLVLHEKPELVAEVEEIGVFLVVRTADSVHARLLELQQAALHRLMAVGRANNAEIVVKAYAVEHDASSVELKPPLVRMEGNRADAVSERLPFDLNRVEMGVVYVPQDGLLDLERPSPAPRKRHLVPNVHRRLVRADVARRDRD